MTNLSGKAVLVLGGSRGIGADIVRRFASDGGSVAFSYCEHNLRIRWSISSPMARERVMSRRVITIVPIGAKSPLLHFQPIEGRAQILRSGGEGSSSRPVWRGAPLHRLPALRLRGGLLVSAFVKYHAVDHEPELSRMLPAGYQQPDDGV